MEWNNRNFTRDSIVKYRDKVAFELSDGRVLNYTVRDSYLTRNGIEIEIFNEIGVDPYDFCENITGYVDKATNPILWPEIKEYDYEGLSKIIYAIYQKINELNTPAKIMKLSEIDIF